MLRNVQGPRRSLILAKLEGGPLADTGVIAGMSGSPVYIDGRLIGAVSYSIGQFAKEPIAGITPIAEMIDATAETSRRATVGAGPCRAPGHGRGSAAAVRQTSARIGSFADRPVDVQARRACRGHGGSDGWDAAADCDAAHHERRQRRDTRSRQHDFSGAGFAPVLADRPAAPIRPSQRAAASRRRVGVSLLGGDAEMGATGTVTHVDGSRVYAFGHPFFNSGRRRFR